MTIIYDDIGNPVLVGEDTYVWEGRKLLSLYDDYEFSNYTYNTDGIRTSKEYGEYDYNGYLHEYTLNGSQIVREVVYYDEDGSGMYVESYTLIYIYDEMGAPIGMKHRTPSYAVGSYDYFFFEKNLQGDIIGIYNSSGVKILSYTYDAWGKFTEAYVDGGPTDISIARKNPFRYRGYYYDNHSGLYYLQSRYYNPTWGRFINADDLSYLGVGDDLLSYNLFAYCGNNPIMYSDPNGHFSFLLLAAIIGAVIGFSTVVYTDYKDDGHVFNGSVKWYEYVGGTVIGTALGAGVGGVISAGGATLASAIASTTNKFVSDLFAYTLTGTKFGTWEDYAVAFISGGLVKGLGMGKVIKTIYDVAGRPIINQVVKIGTNRQDSFNVNKYAYDAVTRGITTFAPSHLKALYRGGVRSLWDLINRRGN